MNHLYQPNFNTNAHLRSKRLRHVHLVRAKNLSIAANKFNVWFTLHQDRASRAFFCSEKRDSERSPHWLPLNTRVKASLKVFILRIWYTNLDPEDSSQQQKTGLNLLFEADINLDCLVPLVKKNASYSTCGNLLVFEMFGQDFCEPLVEMKQPKDPIQRPSSSTTKSSYSLRTLTRLHDFQRVMHESSKKIAKLKQSSMLKFEASAKLRELQARQEELRQKNSLYRQQLAESNKRIDELLDFNETARLRTEASAHQLSVLKASFEQDRIEKSQTLEKTHSLLINAFELEQTRLKRRQRQMVAELADIFVLKRLESNLGTAVTNTRNRVSILNVNFRSYNKANVTVKNVEHQNAVVLGYIIHALSILANILNTPLRHPVIFRGSKSFIVEQLQPESNCEYPLFKHSSSTQDPLFAHAVTLLNKNLSQMRIQFDSYKNVDSNDMLGNLKWILDHL